MYLYVKFYGRDAEELVFKFYKPSQRLPSVLTHAEVQPILVQMNGTPKLMIELLYGSGLRLQECLNLRIKDIDFNLNLRTLTIRQGFDSSLFQSRYEGFHISSNYQISLLTV